MLFRLILSSVTCFVFKWYFLQFIAWVWMLFSYSLDHGLVKAWEMTFSGDYPCPICQLVTTGSSWEMSFWTSVAANNIALSIAIPVIGLIAGYTIASVLEKLRFFNFIKA